MAVNFDQLTEFDRVAGLLQMPDSERRGILNISEELYSGLCAGDAASYSSVLPEFERRLSYALPLMRRLASNSSVVGLPLARRRAA